MSAHRDQAAQMRAMELHSEARDAAARAARDLLALEALVRRGRLAADDALLPAARERFDAAIRDAAPYWSRNARRLWRQHPAELAETLR